MQVATVKTADNKERYMLFDSNGESVDVVNRYFPNTKTAMVQQEIRLKHTAII